MINIIFIYLCFWIFISSCFIRWVVSLNCPPKTWTKDNEKSLLLEQLKLEKELIDNELKILKESKTYENPKEEAVHIDNKNCFSMKELASVNYKNLDLEHTKEHYYYIYGYKDRQNFELVISEKDTEKAIKLLNICIDEYPLQKHWFEDRIEFLEKRLLSEVKSNEIKEKVIENELINTFIKNYENPIKDNDVLNNLYDKVNNNIISENEIRSLFKKEIYKNTRRGYDK
jgi:hypothetical protein